MPYKKEALQIHNTVKQSGNFSQAEIVVPLKVDPMSGAATGEAKIKVYFVQAQYSSQDLADGSIASGLTKLVVSSLDSAGNPIEDFGKILKNKKAVVRFDGGKDVSIKLVKLITPDHKTPIAARVFIGG